VHAGPLLTPRRNKRRIVLPMSLDVLVKTSRRAPRLAGRGLVKAYRYTLSPLIGVHCRHLPTCSDYADQAIDRFGLWAGAWMAVARLFRCHPWGTSGLDFVPVSLPSTARWWVPWRYGRWRKTNENPPA
jgi:uncharacterized protein